MALIRDRILAAQSKQKSYTDRRRRPLEFQIGDFAMLNVLPMKGVRRFGRKDKLALRYTGPFGIVGRTGAMSYRLKLPDSLVDVHDVFYVSMLKRHLRDEQQQVVDFTELQLKPDFTTVEAPVCILADKKLRNIVIPLVKIQWNRRGVEKASWETKKICAGTIHNFSRRHHF